MQRELPAPLQPVEIGAYLDPVGLEPPVRRVPGGSGEDFGRADTVVAGEVGGNGDREASLDVVGELVGATVGRVGEELSDAEEGVEWTGRFVH